MSSTTKSSHSFVHFLTSYWKKIGASESIRPVDFFELLERAKTFGATSEKCIGDEYYS